MMLKQIPETPELLQVARHVIWFKEPKDSLKNPAHFLAYLMNYGLPEDVQVVRKYLTMKDFSEALKEAPPGVFNERTWNYWNLICDRIPVPSLPERKFSA